MDAEDVRARLRGGLFLSSMMGVTDGAFVARHGAGAAMVQIGALVADLQDRTHEKRYLLPAEEADMVPILQAEVRAARASLGDTPVGLNAAPGDLESALRMARAFAKAGGDLFELNCHGAYAKLMARGLLRAMPLPENRPTMMRWLEALCALDVPVVVKFWSRTEGVDFAELLAELAAVEGLFGVHLNVRSQGGAEPNCALVQELAPRVPGVLLCSGHVTQPKHVRALLDAGADCVGLAQGVLHEPDILTRLAGA